MKHRFDFLSLNKIEKTTKSENSPTLHIWYVASKCVLYLFNTWKIVSHSSKSIKRLVIGSLWILFFFSMFHHLLQRWTLMKKSSDSIMFNLFDCRTFNEHKHSTLCRIIVECLIIKWVCLFDCFSLYIEIIGTINISWKYWQQQNLKFRTFCEKEVRIESAYVQMSVRVWKIVKHYNFWMYATQRHFQVTACDNAIIIICNY